LDDYDARERSLETKENAFDEKEDALREQARERGRRQVPVILRKLIHTELSAQPYDPYDIKALLHPVDFVVFDGMNNSDTIKEIAFLSRKPDSRPLAELRASIRTAIRKSSYNCQVARVDIDGNVSYGSK
jgi:predicted Holliday junction resolvase-like endonuclease